LYQGIGLATKNKWLALLFSASIFGLFHFGNSEMIIDFWKMGIIYIGSGVMIGMSVMLSKGIEFGWGFHLINNLYLSTISTFPGSSLSGPTLYAIPKPTGDRILLEFFIQFVIFMLILLVVYRKNVKTLFDQNA
jgi:membrane protease YdiL (CAAX protease family)